MPKKTKIAEFSDHIHFCMNGMPGMAVTELVHCNAENTISFCNNRRMRTRLLCVDFDRGADVFQKIILELDTHRLRSLQGYHVNFIRHNL